MPVKMKKAKTCDGCRAFTGAQGMGARCSLGLGIAKSETIKVGHRKVPVTYTIMVPTAAGCPKPTTYDELFEAMRWMDQVNKGCQL